MNPGFQYGIDHLTVAACLGIAKGTIRAYLGPASIQKITASAAAVAKIVEEGRTVYGVNTGFGILANSSISEEDTRTLQYKILQSHSVGVGNPISPELTKIMLITKVHALAKGYSGIQLATLERLCWMIDQDILPVVPEKGSVGASGDLAPLSHLCLPLIGLGELTEKGNRKPASDVLKAHQLEPVTLGPKEGLALINGTQFILAHAVKAVQRLQNSLDAADIIGAMSLESLTGTKAPFEEALHALRPFAGNQYVAHRLRHLLNESAIMDSHLDCGRVQDPYSLRCMPQVHGASRNAWLHLKELTEIELNSVTDNPIVLDAQHTISGGNFHGQPLALPLDYNCFAAAEIGNMSDRRCYLLLEGKWGLPMLLMNKVGLNSGFMIPQYTTAALVTENKTLCFPASADSIPTSLGQEDHVSMGSISGRKLNQVIDNLEYILAIELMSACQAIEFRRPLKSSPVLEFAHDYVRRYVGFASEDRIFARDIEQIAALLKDFSFVEQVHQFATQEGNPLNTGFPSFTLHPPPLTFHLSPFPHNFMPTTPSRCKGWLQEAALSMLLNNLHPDVAERPEELIVYGGRGKAARNQESLELIIKALEQLENDESLLIQSGKPVAILQTHEDAPRVLISNSQLVPNWANWQHFDELEKKGLMMYGQMTAGSWIYIGSQGIVQGTYETYAAVADKEFGGSLRGTLNVTAGLGGMGGAQPLAITMNEGVALIAEVEEWRIDKRLETRYLDLKTKTIDAAIDKALDAKAKGQALSIGVHCNAVDLLTRLLERAIIPDTLTDQTSAHDPLIGYVPHGITVEAANQLRASNPEAYLEKAYASMHRHVELMLELQQKGAITFDYGNNIRARAKEHGLQNAFDFPGFVPAYIRPLFCEGKGPFRWVALSGDPADIAVTDQVIASLFPENASLQRWLKLAKEKIAFQGLPARICWLGQGEREKAGLAFNELVRTGQVKAPIVIGRDHLDTGSVASPNRETEAMLDGSDAVADWPLLNALLNTAGGASWVSLHHGGGVGMGYSIHAGMVIVADGTAAADKRLARVLRNDPGIGVIRHADAGYDIARDVARQHRLDLKEKLAIFTASKSST